MAKRRILPTSALMPIHPEFYDKFLAHGWRRVENTWGKSRVKNWSKQIGVERMAAVRKRFIADQKRDPKVDIAQYRAALKRKRFLKEEAAR